MTRALGAVAIISESKKFWAEVRRQAHAGYKLVKGDEAVRPKILLFGPDCGVRTLHHWRSVFPGVRWAWARENWTSVDMMAIGSDLLPGCLLAMNEPGWAAEWKAFLGRSGATGESKQDLKISGNRLESLIGFVRTVAGGGSIFELLKNLRGEMQSFRVVGDPILLLSHPYGVSQLFYFRGAETFARTLSEVPSDGLRVRLDDAMDRQFLANQMGRPFGKVIAFPMEHEKGSGSPVRPYIFFEHRMEDAELTAFVDSVGQRLQAVSLVLDRLVFESEMKRSSSLWEKTFDAIEEPIAIVGLNEEIVRSNRQFSAFALTGAETGVIKARESLFKVERYDIRIKDQGPVLSTIVYYQDVTKPMNLREKMIQLEKVSAIGHLAGHIAHELNNPLTGIRSLAQILIRETQAREGLRSDLLEVEAAAGRCQEIILNLLDFSKGNLDAKTSVCDLNEVVAKTLPFLKSALGRFTNNIQLQSPPLWVEMEPRLMQQVVFNLVNNACQALQDGTGEVEIRTFEQVDGPEQFACLSVKDSGPGVPVELQDSIFEPFFTTKGHGQGTGLGLSFSRDFVRRLGGEITCHSRPGEGALFCVRLPLAKRKSRSAAS